MDQMKLKDEEICVSYINCVYEFKRFKLDLFGCEFDQYNRIQSYMVKLTDRAHKTKLEIVDDEFMR